jgi:N-acetylmuramoyl-L-alanine amidase
MTSAEAALERLCSPDHEVSAHYLIGQQGQVWQMVDEDQRAWHAGTGSWQGVDDINSRSIGIELCNDGASPFSAPLMEALGNLLTGIQQRHSITAHGVIGHSDMAPARKNDPGPRFDWARLARLGLAYAPWSDANLPIDATLFHDDITRIGYDAAAPESLSAFRHRTRPWATGPLDARDMALARTWAEAVDGPAASA